MVISKQVYLFVLQLSSPSILHSFVHKCWEVLVSTYPNERHQKGVVITAVRQKGDTVVCMYTCVSSMM